MSFLKSIDRFFETTPQDEFYEFIIELLSRYGVEKGNPNGVYEGYDDRVYFIPSTEYSIKIYSSLDSGVVYIYRDGYRVVEYKTRLTQGETIKNTIDKQMSKNEKEQELIRQEEERQKLIKIMMEDRLKYIENIKPTGEFDKVFAAVKRFKELKDEMDKIYNEFKTT